MREKGVNAAHDGKESKEAEPIGACLKNSFRSVQIHLGGTKETCLSLSHSRLLDPLGLFCDEKIESLSVHIRSLSLSLAL